ncbi:hypothetical protein GDO86_017470 [Hymenochirus boettgeri]|uniref:Centrosome and spindle pole-associated protein 1 C-terminal domain-containing protein n=1 Tax=Hymenochirus boettgeri TaxID=247094 RepID=A0A8T2IQ69_9PIPI|nr:hypothetical protein GDO86_017470 [Hymenochirus boettgeri]
MQSGDINYGLSLPLGEDYERKKHKLKQELRQDYRQYLNKKHLRMTGELDPSTQGMSLPIGERLSAKERLRLERNREYNDFLRIKENDHEKFRLVESENNQNERSIAVSRVRPEAYPSVQLSHRNQEASRKDAYTSMEVYEQLLNKRRSEEDKVETEMQKRPSRKKADDEKIIFNLRDARSDPGHNMLHRPPHNADVPEYERMPHRLVMDARDNGETYRGLRYDLDAQDKRHGPYSHPPERYYKEYEQDPHIQYEEHPRQRPVTSVTKARMEYENTVQNIERSKSAKVKEENFSTGLLLGDSGKDEAMQRKKDRYRQDLMEQMAEQQRNKRREKELGLKVAASGAIDPERADRLRQFGAVNRPNEMSDRNVPYRPGIAQGPEKTGRNDRKPVFDERVPPERPRVAFQTPVPDTDIGGGYFSSVSNDEYHRGLASTFGDIVAPRISAAPPPQPPVLTDNYRTPYDDAYYYYGARNPLDPNMAYYPSGAMSHHPVPGINIPLAQIVQNQHEDPLYVIRKEEDGGRGTSLGLLSDPKSQPSKGATKSYQDALEGQIRERNEKRRKEKEEQEQYDAKMEAEMRNYNPWGKGGGGAPLRDAKGNLISDLKRMHKHNEGTFQNPDAKAYEDLQAVVDVNPNLASATASASKMPGVPFTNNSPFARGNVFAEPPSEQQVQQKESYKEFLRLQIDEKRRREDEEREQLRLLEEKEEKRLAEERAKIQREYEEEQNKKRLKEEEQRQLNEELMRKANEKRTEEERKRKEWERIEEDQLRQYENEKAAQVIEEQIKHQRSQSPPIPTLQKRDTSEVQRPPSTDGYVSGRSHVEPQSRNVSPPVPARRNQLRAYDQKEDLINQLSELRKQLRSQQRHLQGQLLDADRENASSASVSSRRKEKNKDVFDLARKKLQASTRRPSLKGTEVINTQNIREFNNLKYRDTATREGVLHMYPDPPKDDETLDIQQQALLREQHKNLNKMKSRTIMQDDFETSAPVYSIHHNRMLKDPSSDLLKTSLLESESAFIGENGDPFEFFNDVSQVVQQPSARERRRHKDKPLDYDDIPHVPSIPLHQPDTVSVHSGSSMNVDELRFRNEERLKRLSNLQRSSLSTDNEPDVLGDADDILKFFPGKTTGRPNSVDTVATDPWLRPGTSETLKRFMAGQERDRALTLNLQGLSTAHG